MKNQEKKAVLIMGMHRSGTSVLSAGVEAIGISLGLKTDWVSDENPKGFYENSDITPFNDRLLNFFGASWDNPFFDCRNAIIKIEYHLLKPWYDEAIELLRKNFSGTSIWSLKDPRMCLLLPFWQKAFSDFGIKPVNTFYLFIVRNPIEVSLSQEKRQYANPDSYFIGKDHRQTMLLWFLHYFRSFKELNSNNTIVFTHDKLIHDTEKELKRLLKFLKIDCQKKVLEKKIKEFSCTFVDKNLYRSRKEYETGAAVLKSESLIGEMYLFLLKLSKEEDVSMERLKMFIKKQKQIFELFNLAASVSEAFSSSWHQYHDEKKQKEQLLVEKELVDKELLETRQLLEEVLQSQSWRIVVNIRQVLNVLPGGALLSKVIKMIFLYKNESINSFRHTRKF